MRDKEEIFKTSVLFCPLMSLIRKACFDDVTRMLRLEINPKIQAVVAVLLQSKEFLLLLPHKNGWTA